MVKFVEFTSSAGEKLAINPEFVVCINQYGGKERTGLSLSNGQKFGVDMTKEEIMRKLQGLNA